MTVEKDITELSEEIFIRRYPEYVMNGEPLSPYYDLFASGYEIANIEKDKQIEELKKIEEEYYDFIQKKNEEDWKGDNVVGCLKLKIEQLKAQIEKMKCCEICAKSKDWRNRGLCVECEQSKSHINFELRR